MQRVNCLSQPLETPLTPYQQLLINRLERSFRLSVNKWVNSVTDIVTPEFENTFRTRLLYHHTVTDEVLNKKSFEYAFRDASRMDGKKSELNTSSTASSFDVKTEDVRFSLKTQAEEGISRTRIHISKLRECAWLRYVDGSFEKLIGEIHKYVLPLFDGYERVLCLRIFRGEGLRTIQYDLVEIPKEMFLAIGDLKPNDFSPFLKTHGTSAIVHFKGQPAFTLRFDGSDEKITISGLRVDLCVIHAYWEIPVVFTEEGTQTPKLDL